MYEGPALPPGGLPEPEPEPEEIKVEKKKKEEGEWYEAMSDMGYPYYWNTVTGGKWYERESDDSLTLVMLNKLRCHTHF